MERRVTTNGKVYRVEFRELMIGQPLPPWTAYSARYTDETAAFEAMDRMNRTDAAMTLEVWTPVAPLVESVK